MWVRIRRLFNGNTYYLCSIFFKQLENTKIRGMQTSIHLGRWRHGRRPQINELHAMFLKLKARLADRTSRPSVRLKFNRKDFSTTKESCGNQYHPTKLMTTQHATMRAVQFTRGKFTRQSSLLWNLIIFIIDYHISFYAKFYTIRYK